LLWDGVNRAGSPLNRQFRPRPLPTPFRALRQNRFLYSLNPIPLAGQGGSKGNFWPSWRVRDSYWLDLGSILSPVILKSIFSGSPNSFLSQKRKHGQARHLGDRFCNVSNTIKGAWPAAPTVCSPGLITGRRLHYGVQRECRAVRVQHCLWEPSVKQ